MSNTEGGLERSSRRHKPALIGIAVALLAVLVVLLVLAPWRAPDEMPDQAVVTDSVAPAAETPPATPATSN